MAELGLDLGTWSVAAALLDGRGCRPVPDPVSGQSWFRAAIALAPDGSWLVGRGAEELRATHPDRYRDDLKRHLDTGAPVYLAGAAHSVPDLLAVLIARVLRQAQPLTTDLIEVVRMGVPVAFEGDRRDALRTAVQAAGFTGEIELIPEPVAAARVALGATPQAGTWLVFDLGGGTLDLALVSTDRGELTLVDTAGTDEVGGFAIDEALVDVLRRQCGLSFDEELDPADLADLITAARSLKHQLSDGTIGYARNPLRTGPRQLTLTGDQLAGLARPVVDAACRHAETLMAANGLSWPSLTGTVPTGGATRSPAVRNGLGQRARLVLPSEPPELVTVLGLVPVSLPDPETQRLMDELKRLAVTDPGVPAARVVPAELSGHAWLDSRGRQPITALTVHDVEHTATNNDHADEVWAVAFSPDARFLASAGNDETVRVWDRGTGTELVLDDHDDCVRALAFDPESELLASAGYDKKVRLWLPGSGSTRSVALAGHTDGIKSVAYSTHGLLATGGDDQTVRIWDGRDGDVIAKLPFDAEVNAVAFAPDGRRLVVATDDDIVMITLPDVEVEGEVDGSATALAFSPDGFLLAAGDSDGTIRIWETGSGHDRWVAERKNGVSCLAFNPAGDVLAVGSASGTNVHLYRVSDGYRLTKLDHDGEYVNSLAFSPDGTMLVTGTDEYSLFVWQVG